MTHVVIYRDESGESRWRKVASNGEIIADSSEGYTERNDAREAAIRANPEIDEAQIRYEED